MIKDILRHSLTYSRKVGQVAFAVGQVEIRTPCQQTEPAKTKTFVEPWLAVTGFRLSEQRLQVKNCGSNLCEYVLKKLRNLDASET